MYINNTNINLVNEKEDKLDKLNFPNYNEVNDFINNLMLNPQKYRQFKQNINRINNIENEKNYLRSLEKKNEINFLDSIIISEEEYRNSLKDEETIFENINEDILNDLLSHKKLLSHEKYLLETMAYFLGYESFDWNMFKKILNIHTLKYKFKNVNYSQLKKRRINTLLGQLCRSDRFSHFLNMNDFSDSGLEFVYEWVKTQLKIFFYIYQNNKIKKMYLYKSSNNISDYEPLNYSKLEEQNNSNSNSNYNSKYNINNIINLNNLNNSNIINKEKVIETNRTNYSNYIKSINNKSKISDNNNKNNDNININNTQLKKELMDSNILKNSTNIETNNHNITSKISNNSNINIINNKSTLVRNFNYNNNTNSSNISLNNLKKFRNKSTILLTSLPYITNDQSKMQTNEVTNGISRNLKISNISQKMNYLKEAKKVSVKLMGYNKEKEKILREIRTAEMLPLLKNKTFPMMRNYFEEKMPFSKKIEKKVREDINYFSLNGTQDEKKMISLLASGKMKAFNLESLFKLRNILKT